MRTGTIVLRQMARNARAAVRAARGIPAGDRVVSGGEMSPGDAAAYAEGAYASILRAGLSESDLRGAAVLEIGPGETLALALRLFAAGAEKVVAVDRFLAQAPLERQLSVYRALTDRLEPAERGRATAALVAGEPPLDETKISLIAGVPIEEAGTVLPRGSFDAVVSIAALQHTSDLRAALEVLASLLRPGGTMVHQVDLGDM